MKSKTERILIAMRVIAYIAMIGYSINCGSQAISLAVSLINPAASKQIPGITQNLSSLYQNDLVHYVISVSFVILLSAMYVYLWIMVIALLSKLNIDNPFTVEVSNKLERIAYLLFAVWIISFVGEDYIRWLSKEMGEKLDIIKSSNELLFTSGIVYIISQIFKRGVEIQEENQQTI